MIKRFLLALLSASVFTACDFQPNGIAKDDLSGKGLPAAQWRGEIALNDSVNLPFVFLTTAGDTNGSFSIRNAQEKVEGIWQKKGDSIEVTLNVFANFLRFSWQKDSSLAGYYQNPDAENYRLPFKARQADKRFAADHDPCCDIDGEWAMDMNLEDSIPAEAIAYFEQTDRGLQGTVMTETGDYRYLDGVLEGRRLMLSTFDGGFLYYFEAEVLGDTMLAGHFWSGRSFHTRWAAKRDSNFRLANPDSLTFLKEGYSSIDFSFPDLSGQKLSLSDPQFANKPVIVQIMGSWCPNCMDESRYLKEVQAKHGEDLAIVGLTFERARDRETALKRARKMQQDLDLPYPILLAGATRDDKAEDALPMLNHIMSYPTAIFLNKNHEVVRIHTGFSGPGTPKYQEFKARYNRLIENLTSDNNTI